MYVVDVVLVVVVEVEVVEVESVVYSIEDVVVPSVVSKVVDCVVDEGSKSQPDWSTALGQSQTLSTGSKTVPDPQF